MARKRKTVRGIEGVACLQMKDELLAREPWTAFQVYVTKDFGSGPVKMELFRCRTREEAESRLASHTRQPASVYAVEEVQVRFVRAGREVREEVVS